MGWIVREDRLEISAAAAVSPNLVVQYGGCLGLQITGPHRVCAIRAVHQDLHQLGPRLGIAEDGRHGLERRLMGRIGL